MEVETEMYGGSPFVPDEEWQARVGTQQQDKRGFVLYQAWRTVGEMLSDRSYEINEKDFCITFEEFRQRVYGDQSEPDYEKIYISCPHPEYSDSKVFVMFVGAIKERISKALLTSLHSQKAFRFILIEDQQAPSENMLLQRRGIDDLYRKKRQGCVMSDVLSKFDFETFNVGELFFNKARYSSLGSCKVRYQLAPPSEKEPLLKDLEILLGEEGDGGGRERIRHKLSVSNMESDSFFTRYFALKEGDVLKCTVAAPLLNALVKDSAAEGAMKGENIKLEEPASGYKEEGDAVAVDYDSSEVHYYVHTGYV